MLLLVRCSSLLIELIGVLQAFDPVLDLLSPTRGAVYRSDVGKVVVKGQISDDRPGILEDHLTPPGEVFEDYSLEKGDILHKASAKQVTPHVEVLDRVLDLRMAVLRDVSEDIIGRMILHLV